MGRVDELIDNHHSDAHTITFVRFTCQWRMVVAARIFKYQCVRVVAAGPKQLEISLYLANVKCRRDNMRPAESRGSPALAGAPVRAFGIIQPRAIGSDLRSDSAHAASPAAR